MERQLMRCSNCGNDLPEGVRFCPKCGSAVAPATTPFTNAQPTSTFGAQSSLPLSSQSFTGGGMVQQKKSGCGKAFVIVLVIGALLLATLGGIGYFGYRALNDKLKSSEAYTVAVATLKENPAVTDKMGPITETGFPIGSFSENADGTGEAAYHMSVTGTKASGTYNVVMMRRARKWLLATGRVTLADGEVINLHPPVTDATPGGANDNSLPPPPQPPGKGKASPIVSGGVLDGKAVSKPNPAYPAAAKAVKASGTVLVQVTVDEQGKVISAHAVSGHPLLQSAAVAAAYQARFAPTLLSGRPVKVNGVLTYNFELSQ
jgi:TonB family protein